MFNFFSFDKFDVQQGPFASIVDNYQRFIKSWNSKTWLGRSIYLFSKVMFTLPQVEPIVLLAQRICKFIQESSDIKQPKSATVETPKPSKNPLHNQKLDNQKLENQKPNQKNSMFTEISKLIDDEVMDLEEDNKATQENEELVRKNKQSEDEELAKEIQEELDREQGHKGQPLKDEDYAKKLQEELDQEQGHKGQSLKDEEYAKKLQDEFDQLDRRKKSDKKDDPVKDDDEAMARKIQEELYAEEETKKNSVTSPPKSKEDASSKSQVASSSNDPMTLEEIEKKQKEEDATYQILKTPGFVACEVLENEDDKKSKKITVHELATGKLRAVTATLTRDYPQAISSAALRAQRDVNFEQYLAFKLKQFSHIEEVMGVVTLPSGKKIKLEGFFEVFATPMVISSYETFSKTSTFFKAKDREWILSQFNQMIFCDYVFKKEIEDIVTKLQSPDFVGPLMLQTGFRNHCALLIWVGDYLLYTDRGCINTEPGTYVFHIPDRQLITEQFISEVVKRLDIKEEDYRMLENILSELNAKLIYYEHQSRQNVGNCTHATMDGGLDDLMAIRQLLNANGGKLNQINGAAAWQSAFDKVRPEHTKASAFERQEIFDDMMSEIEEWLTHKTSIGAIKLKGTYEELLICWLYTPNVKRDAKAEKRVQNLLAALAKES